MNSILNILEGWGRLVADKFDRLDEETKQVASKRMSICDSCELRLGSICNPSKVAPHTVTGNLVKGCGCNLPAKTLATKTVCPRGLW
jgi:hypothetical protein